ncbi:PE-PPE domain-containing protein [Mycobacterium camsae]|uniref:PE-PPE domain-containing protein n=1 Tax=Mycobacterium gordonae TaxID=1778 RepID=UPI001980C98E|nr:PE-PPE domain-containing protein [Mycobacterium gordonae]
MSYVVAAPDFLLAAAEDLAATGSVISAASAAVAHTTTSLSVAAEDEVSKAVAALFGGHGREYQAVATQAAHYHERLTVALAASVNAYASTEAANAYALPNAAAATRITVPGAGPLYLPNFFTRFPYLGQLFYGSGVPGPVSVSILQGYDLINHAIGQNWFPGSLAQVVNYPASMGLLSGSLAAPDVNDAVAMGQGALNDQIMNAVLNGGGSPISVAALSQGTIVVNRQLAYLAANPGAAPPPHALQFVLFASPELGVLQTYLPDGFTLPIVNYTVQPLANTQYDVDVVFAQYDGWAHFPDRPWNIPAVVNSLFGVVYYHNTASLASMSEAIELSSVATPLGGTITTYMIPSPTLPILLPLQQLGVAQSVINNLNAFLQPLVNSGYSSLAPDTGPYFSHGSLVLGI